MHICATCLDCGNRKITDMRVCAEMNKPIKASVILRPTWCPKIGKSKNYDEAYKSVPDKPVKSVKAKREKKNQ